jgi:hypothetical protein
MDKKIVTSINNKVYRRFPELNGNVPKIQSQNARSKNARSLPTYLFIYSGTVRISGNKTMPRLVRVVVNEKGKILKISTSR